VEGLAGNEESMPARRVAAGHSPPSAVGQPSRLFNGLTFGIAQMFGVLPGGVFQYPDSSGVAR